MYETIEDDSPVLNSSPKRAEKHEELPAELLDSLSSVSRLHHCAAYLGCTRWPLLAELQ